MICPGCGRVMSKREAAEQGACNDCNGGAYDPRDGEHEQRRLTRRSKQVHRY